MYVKLFRSIFQGTLRGNSNGLLVFTNLLANCDRDGVVDVHPRAIAEEVGLDVETVRAVLVDLESPDAESRTPDEEGRRIVRMDDHRAWGWRVVNYGKYRAIKNEDDRREANRLAVAKHRAKASTPVNIVNTKSSPVITGNAPSSLSAQAEAEGDTEAKRERGKTSPASRAARGSRLPQDWGPDEDGKKFAVEHGVQDGAQEVAKFRDYWIAQPGARGVKLDWAATWRNWVRNRRVNGAPPVPATEWHETKGGVNAKAVELGIPAWNECEPFAQFRRRVVEAERVRSPKGR